METSYYVICRVDGAGNKSYIYEISNNNSYADKDYTKGLRIYNKEVAVGLAKEIKSNDYRFYVVEVKTTLTEIE